MKPQKHTEALGSLPIGRLLASIAIPSSLALFVTSTYSFVDAIFVGRGVGPEAIGALTLVMPLQMLVMSLGSLVAIGASSIVSRSLGEEDYSRACKAAGNAFSITVVGGAALALLAEIFIGSFVGLLGASEELLLPTRQYLAIVLLTEPILMFNLAANALIRAEGQARVAMSTMIVGMLVNIALDPLFIFGFSWGVRGAAWATVIGRSTTTVLMLLYYLRGNSSLRIKVADLVPRSDILRETAAIGFSAFVRQAGTSFAAMLRNNLLVAHGGTMFISAFGAVFRSIIFLGMPGMGIAQAVQPIAGYNYGAGNYDRVRRSVWVSIGVCTTVMLIGFAITELFPATLLRLFSSDAALVSEGVKIMRISAIIFLTFPAYIIAPSFYQALGKPGSALVLSLARPVLVVVVMLIGVRISGAMGVVYADPIAVSAAAIFALFYLRSSMRRLGQD